MKFLIVGAGMFGASTAYDLACRGHQVEIVDEVHPGKATLAGAGIVCPWATRLTDPDWYAMYAAGARYYGELIAGLEARGETDLGYRRVGALIVSENPAEFAAAGERIAARTADAPEAGEIRRLGSTEARALFPPLREGLEAIHIAGGARVDARRLSAAMVRAAVTMGARYRNDYITLSTHGGRARALDSTGREIAADEIVVCAGAWAAQILRPLGLMHPVKPQKGQIVHLRLAGTATANWPVLLPMNSYYMLAFDDSRIVVGATREDDSGFDYRVTAEGQFEVLGAGLDIAPGLADAELIETRIGFRPAASSVRPIIGRVPGFDNLALGNGLGAGGISIGPFAGRLLAQSLVGEKPELPIEAYAPGA